MGTTKLTYKKAEKLLLDGQFIKLPEWGGFWFKDRHSEKVMVLTKDNEILDAPHDEYKSRKDWEVAVATDDQIFVMDNYYSERQEEYQGQKGSDKVWVSNSKLLKSVENRRQGVRRVENGKVIGGLEFYGELK